MYKLYLTELKICLRKYIDNWAGQYGGHKGRPLNVPPETWAVSGGTLSGRPLRPPYWPAQFIVEFIDFPFQKKDNGIIRWITVNNIEGENHFFGIPIPFPRTTVPFQGSLNFSRSVTTS